MARTSGTQRIEKDARLSGVDAIAKVQALLPSFKTAMFVTGVRSCHEVHARPLALHGDPCAFTGTLWFFADDRSPKVYELAVDTVVSLLFQSDGDSRYLQLDGTGALSKDMSKMQELYTPSVRTYFPDGLQDPHLTLIRFDAVRGAYWNDGGGAWKNDSGILDF